jgi:predicted  nucleic acid-binding Zn-ribbon protein
MRCLLSLLVLVKLRLMNVSPSNGTGASENDVQIPENLRTQLEDAVHRLRLAEDEVAQLKAQLEEKDTRIVSLEQDVSKYREEAKGFLTDLQICRGDRDNLRSRLLDSSAAAEASLVASLTKQVQRLERELDESHASVAVLTDANRKLATRSDRLEASIGAMRRDYDNVFKGLFAEKQSAEMQRDQAVAQVTEANSRCDEMVRSLSAAQRMIEANNLEPVTSQMDAFQEYATPARATGCQA